MISKKKILFIVISIIIICAVGLTGAYFGNLIFPKPAVVKIQPPLRTNIITGWDAYMRGTVTEITDNQMSIISNNGMEAVVINFLSGDKKTVFQIPKAGKNGEVENIDQKEIQVGDEIFLRSSVSSNGTYSAFWVLKFLK